LEREGKGGSENWRRRLKGVVKGSVSDTHIIIWKGGRTEFEEREANTPRVLGGGSGGFVVP